MFVMLLYSLYSLFEIIINYLVPNSTPSVIKYCCVHGRPQDFFSQSGGKGGGVLMI